MFYNLHRDTTIGYKLLSDSDLGRGSSNQTHIGLLEGTLEFIPNYQQEASAQLIYEDTVIEGIDFLDPIRRPNGTIRSPKIRSGTQQELIKYPKEQTSIVNTIRNISRNNPHSQWFLFWFALEDNELVFILIKENSTTYIELKNILSSLKIRDIIDKKNPYYKKIFNFFTSKINYLNIAYFQELELINQTTEAIITKRIKPKPHDIEKAQEIFQKIGKQGEELVNIYLEKEKYKGKIKNFTWVNKNNESGLPFDFEITNNKGERIYSDAKSTSYKFEQPIFFSSQELKFIHQNNNYLIHRVFNLKEEPKLKICHNIESISHDFIKELNIFSQKINHNGLLFNSMKISINPSLPSLYFNHEVNL